MAITIRQQAKHLHKVHPWNPPGVGSWSLFPMGEEKKEHSFRMPLLVIGLVMMSGVLLLTGCLASRHYSGYKLLSKKEVQRGFVHRKVEEEVRPLEREFLSTFMGDDLPNLKKILTPRFYASLDRERQNHLLSVLEKRYGVTGRSIVMENELNVRKSFLNDTLKLDAFEIYDYIGVSFWLEGTRRDARMDMYFIRNEGRIRICGLRILDVDYNPDGHRYDEFLLELD